MKVIIMPSDVLLDEFADVRVFATVWNFLHLFVLLGASVVPDQLFAGQFGVVNLALYRGKTYVAVKIMKENTMQEDSFIEEAQVMT